MALYSKVRQVGALALIVMSLAPIAQAAGSAGRGAEVGTRVELDSAKMRERGLTDRDIEGIKKALFGDVKSAAASVAAGYDARTQRAHTEAVINALRNKGVEVPRESTSILLGSLHPELARYVVTLGEVLKNRANDIQSKQLNDAVNNLLSQVLDAQLLNHLSNALSARANLKAEESKSFEAFYDFLNGELTTVIITSVQTGRAETLNNLIKFIERVNTTLAADRSEQQWTTAMNAGLKYLSDKNGRTISLEEFKRLCKDAFKRA